MPADRNPLEEGLAEAYPDAVRLDSQPEWIDALVDSHDAIETAFVRVQGATPVPQLELAVTNSASDETGWHRLELDAEGWHYPFANPPAGVVATLEFLEQEVDTDAFREWYATTKA